ncbi:MAG: terminase large subunit domain-containing protein [Opitutia bacterium]|jgi:hypothetical protein
MPQPRRAGNLAEDEALPKAPPVIWKPHAGFQTKALTIVADEVFIGGAAGPGKTDVLLYGPLRDIHHPAVRILFLRRTFPELREAMDRTLRTFPALGGTWREAEKRWLFPSGATYEFGFCEHYRDVLRYQGQEFTHIHFDELGQVPDERIVDFLTSRLRSTDPAIRPRFAGSGNPGGPGHAILKSRYIQPTQGGKVIYRVPGTTITRAFVPGRLADNPSLPESYRQRLLALPERLRRQLLEGDWDLEGGMALDELDETQHIVRPFGIPPHWEAFAGFDWGFRHPWVFVAGVVDPDGDLYIVDVAWGRRQLPHEIAMSVVDTIGSTVPLERIGVIAAGHDCFHARRAMDENTPTIAETFLDYRLILQKANVHRVLGLNHCRSMLAWRTVEKGEPGQPRLRFFDTPRCRRLFEALRTLVTNPANPEDVLKIDADDDTGQGHDDFYDAFRYAITSRPLPNLSAAVAGELPALSSFSPEILAAEHEAKYRHRSRPLGTHPGLDGGWFAS